MLKRYFLICLLLASVTSFAQNTINNYKYVIVPSKFSFLKEIDQYRLNTLAKVFLEDKGFTVYYDDDVNLPTEIGNNKCAALNADVQEKNTMFLTKLIFTLKDCKGNVLFTSKEGKSREKEFKTSYNAALREALESLNEVNYSYVQKAEVPIQIVAVPAVAEALKVVETVMPNISTQAIASQGILYAQPVKNGYQLINTAPKIVLTLLKTSVAEYFIANNGTVNGIVLKKNGDWYFEYYQNNELISEKLSIKF